MLSREHFDYQLPKSLIAHQPLVNRSHSKLLVLDRVSGKIKHYRFSNLPELLNPGDVLVRNQTKVIPARIQGHRSNGRPIEILLLRDISKANTVLWLCLTKPGLNQGESIQFSDSIVATNRSTKDCYQKTLEFSCTHAQLLQFLDTHGTMPLPPYITPQAPESVLREQYQTTYAQIAGSAAAPTAGLHFTPTLDAQLESKGIDIVSITLHVGLGTFAPLREESFVSQQLHAEWYHLPQATVDRINQAKSAGKRIIAVGTTTVRTLEHVAKTKGAVVHSSGITKLFILPPYPFQVVDGMITNFHLPKSSLLALVSAFVSAPNSSSKFTTFAESSIGKSYQIAIQNQYRFYSFGDAMLIT